MVLFIAKRPPWNIIANLHLKALQDIYGANEVFVVDLLRDKHEERENYISFGYSGKDAKNRILSYIQGNINFINDSIINRLLEIIKEKGISLIYTEESDLGRFCKKAKEAYPNIKLICFFHDISAELFETRIADAPKWKLHYILECKRVISQEKMCQQYADEKWVFHSTDSQRFFNKYGYYPDQIITMAYTDPIPWKSEDETITQEMDNKTLLFICSNYYVNAKGFKWFYNNVYPALNKKFNIKVVGRGSKELDYMACDDIQIVGGVDSMEPYFREADIVIIPVFDGGGMKIKTVEALTYGKYIVSTSESLNGYWEVLSDQVKNHQIFQCDTAEEWVKTLNALFDERIERISKNVLDTFYSEFSYDTLLKRYREALGC